MPILVLNTWYVFVYLVIEKNEINTVVILTVRWGQKHNTGEIIPTW